MKLNHTIKIVMAIAFTGLIALSSCKKEDVQQPSSGPAEAAAKEATESEAGAEAQYDEVFNITMGVQLSDASEEIGIGTGVDVIYQNRTNPDGNYIIESPVSPPCFTVSVTPTTPHAFPKTVTIDFGSGCIGRDGKMRKGKIVSIYTGPMVVTGSKCTTSFEEYFVDSFKIEGRHSVENTSVANHKQWTVKAVEGKIININSSAWRTWSSTKTHTQIEGNVTPHFPLDDVFQISGSAIGNASNGNSWTGTIVEPLIKKIGCRWITKGIIHITKNDLKAELDYGDGHCDNKAVITINGTSYNIILHK